MSFTEEIAGMNAATRQSGLRMETGRVESIDDTTVPDQYTVSGLKMPAIDHGTGVTIALGDTVEYLTNGRRQVLLGKMIDTTP